MERPICRIHKVNSGNAKEITYQFFLFFVPMYCSTSTHSFIRSNTLMRMIYWIALENQCPMQLCNMAWYKSRISRFHVIETRRDPETQKLDNQGCSGPQKYDLKLAFAVLHWCTKTAPTKYLDKNKVPLSNSKRTEFSSTIREAF